jgi:protein ImuA
MNKFAPSPPTPALLFAPPGGGFLHEIHGRAGDAGAVSGFGLAAAALAAEGRTVLWVCPEFGSLEAGRPYGVGLHEYGLNPAHFVIARTRSDMETLQAALEGARCAGIGAVLAAGSRWRSVGRAGFSSARRRSRPQPHRRLCALAGDAGAFPRAGRQRPRRGGVPRAARASSRRLAGTDVSSGVGSRCA